MLTNLVTALREHLCEVLISWALAVAPEGYVPSCVEACLDAYRQRGAFSPENLKKSTI